MLGQALVVCRSSNWTGETLFPIPFFFYLPINEHDVVHCCLNAFCHFVCIQVKNTLKNLGLPAESVFPPSATARSDDVIAKYHFQSASTAEISPASRKAAQGSLAPVTVGFSRLLRFNVGVGGGSRLLSWTPFAPELFVIHPVVSAPSADGSRAADLPEPCISEWHRDLGSLVYVAPITDNAFDSFIVTHRRRGIDGAPKTCLGIIQAFTLPALVRTIGASTGNPRDVVACVVLHRIAEPAILENAAVHAQALVIDAHETGSLAVAQADPIIRPSSAQCEAIAMGENERPTAFASVDDIPTIQAFVTWCRDCGFSLPHCLLRVAVHPASRRTGIDCAQDATHDLDTESLSRASDTAIQGDDRMGNGTAPLGITDAGGPVSPAGKKKRRKHQHKHHKGHHQHHRPRTSKAVSPGNLTQRLEDENSKAQCKAVAKDRRRAGTKGGGRTRTKTKRSTVLIEDVLKEPPRHELTISGSATPGVHFAKGPDDPSALSNEIASSSPQDPGPAPSPKDADTVDTAVVTGSDHRVESPDDEVDRVARRVREEIARRRQTTGSARASISANEFVRAVARVSCVACLAQ